MSNINWITQKELEYIIEKKYIDIFPNLEKSLHEPRFTINDLNVTPRDATYWDKKNILPTLQPGNTTRRKYTLKQAIWIKIIQQLRSFDISLNQIRKIKENVLMNELSAKTLLENEEVRFIVQQLSKQTGNTIEFENFLADPEFQKELAKKTFDNLEIFIVYTMIFRRDVSYIIFEDGECFPYVFDKHEYFVKEIEDFGSIMKQPHLTISISKAYSQLITDWSEKSWLEEISILTKEEIQIIELLRDDRTQELKIYKNGKKPDRVIQVSKEKSIALNDFANYIVKNGYQNVIVNTRRGKPVNFRSELSIKLNE